MNDADQEPELTLAGQGFRMPAEWHPHAATWLAWPHNNETWPNNLKEAQDEFLQLVFTIAADEPVVVIAPEEQHPAFNDAMRQYPNSQSHNISLFNIQTNDAWARDYAPTFVINPDAKELAAVDWHYNAWGGKYPPFDDDQRVAIKIANRIRLGLDSATKCHYAKSPLCLEGGAIEVNGSGIAICTRSCALNSNRNPDLSEPQVTEILKSNLGVETVVWIDGEDSERGLKGDDTDGHIDQLARFTPKGLLYAWSINDDQANAPLQRNFQQLQSGLLSAGFSAEMDPLPLPSAVLFDGKRLPASYCNFYITNHSVIVPQFSDPADVVALDLIGRHFPERKIFGLPSTNIAVGLGSFHCLTQQQPRVSR